MSIYSEIKKAVTARDAAVHYGHRVGRNGMMRCPFHNDRTPSMKVDQNFICFGCREKGDVIRFTEKLFGLTPCEAAKKLISDFGLPIETSRSGKSPPGRRKAKTAKRRIPRRGREESRAVLFQKTKKRMENAYCNYFRLLNEWREEYAPRSQADEFHPLFVEALQKADYVEYLLDIMQYGSVSETAMLMIEKGKEVKELETRMEYGRLEETGSEDPGEP